MAHPGAQPSKKAIGAAVQDVVAKRNAILERQKELVGPFSENCALELAAARQQALQLGIDVSNMLRGIEHLAHRIHGTAALFGRQHLSIDAGTLERWVEAQILCPPDEATVREHAADHISRLEREIDQLFRSAE